MECGLPEVEEFLNAFGRDTIEQCMNVSEQIRLFYDHVFLFHCLSPFWCIIGVETFGASVLDLGGSSAGGA